MIRRDINDLITVLLGLHPIWVILALHVADKA